ncbi:MAG: tRNA lysidine(34) synthetase TilS [Synergistales bacterium]|nr:tRNA lysidine(34) synthetase TilS [Synergistales bacterium]
MKERNIGDKLLYRCYQRLIETGERQGWWKDKGPMLMAVSGGGDSVALLWLLKKFWDGQIVAAHLEHGIRGDDSKGDARFVAELCSQWDVPLVMESVSVPELQRPGEGLEAAARRIRYDFLRKAMKETGARWVALGHTKDDLVETVLFNLFRGSGIYGLAGIPERRGELVRPLIEMRRDELRELLKEHSIPWREDSTNLDVRYSRNLIRNELVPWLEERLNPNAREHVAALAAEALAWRKVHDDRCDTILETVRAKLPLSFVAWRRAAALALANEDVTLSSLVRREGMHLGLKALNRGRTTELASLIEKGGRWRFQWEKDIEVCGSSSHIAWVRRDVLRSGPAPISVSVAEALSMRMLQWGPWRFIFEKAAREAAPHVGTHQARICCRSKDETVMVTPVCCFRDAERFRAFVPWWLEAWWPILSISSTITYWMPLYGGRHEPQNRSGPRMSICVTCAVEGERQSVRGNDQVVL